MVKNTEKGENGNRMVYVTKFIHDGLLSQSLSPKHL